LDGVVEGLPGRGRIESGHRKNVGWKDA
jgi:hypothetical protein